MRNVFLKISIYALLLALLVFTSLIILSKVVSSREFKNNETESNLLVLKENKKYDVLMMGISHARNFSRHGNHQKMENALDKKIINIGQGSGACGINEQLFYLDYFYYLDNDVKKVVYVISPPLFFSETLPMASNTFNLETFRPSFLWRYLSFDSENKKQRVTSYMQTKLSAGWLKRYPKSLDRQDKKLDSIDVKAIAKGQESAYDVNDFNMEQFAKSAIRVEETIDLALKNESEVILIITPTLFGKWKGNEILEEFSKRMTEKKGVSYYDFSEVINDPSLYYDHHHLNTDGVVLFTEQCLKPILK